MRKTKPRYLYKEATVIDYADKKIWIKHVDKNLYCVNGVCIATIPQLDLTYPETLARAVDEWYSPLHMSTDRDTIIVYELEKEEGNTFYYSCWTMHMDSCEHYGVDVSHIDEIFAEYSEWAKGRTNIYINDLRTEDVNKWLYSRLYDECD